MMYLKLFYEFFKIGLFTFGGGYAMIPVVEDVVLKNNWLTIDQFNTMLGICESTPGPMAVNMATYIGTNQGNLLGSVIATIGVVLPSYLIILIISSILTKFDENKYVKRFINGIKPIIASLVIITGLVLLLNCIFSYNEFNSEIMVNEISLITFINIVLISFLYKKIKKKNLSAIHIIILSAIFGILLSFFIG